MATKYDAIVIGTGQAGPSLATSRIIVRAWRSCFLGCSESAATTNDPTSPSSYFFLFPFTASRPKMPRP